MRSDIAALQALKRRLRTLERRSEAILDRAGGRVIGWIASGCDRAAVGRTSLPTADIELRPIHPRVPPSDSNRLR